MKGKASNNLALLALFVAVLLYLPGISRADPDADRDRWSELIFFGDSLSDPGNAYLLTGQVSTAPYEVIPDSSSPYDIGGHHFSNGPTWAEGLAQRLGRKDSGSPALSDPTRFGNFAFGGARARFTAQSSSAREQVTLFLQARGYVANSDALYVVQFGGNDMRDALLAAASGDMGAVFTIMSEAIMATAGNIQWLYAAGARDFLVANVPNLGLAPAIVGLGISAEASYLISIYNGLLEGALQGLDAAPGIEIHRLDLFAFITGVVANPEAFDISNVTVPCLSFGVVEDAVCDDPGDYLFWDGIHPTRKGHKKLAQNAIRVLREEQEEFAD